MDSRRRVRVSSNCHDSQLCDSTSEVKHANLTAEVDGLNMAYNDALLSGPPYLLQPTLLQPYLVGSAANQAYYPLKPNDSLMTHLTLHPSDKKMLQFFMPSPLPTAAYIHQPPVLENKIRSQFPTQPIVPVVPENERFLPSCLFHLQASRDVQQPLPEATGEVVGHPRRKVSPVVQSYSVASSPSPHESPVSKELVPNGIGDRPSEQNTPTPPQTKEKDSSYSGHRKLKKSWIARHNLEVGGGYQPPCKKSLVNGFEKLMADPHNSDVKNHVPSRIKKEVVSGSDAFSITKDETPTRNYHKMADNDAASNEKVYIQRVSCTEVTPKPSLMCRECKLAKTKPSKDNNSYCRFVQFRRLKASKNKYPAVAGFQSVRSHCRPEEAKYWQRRSELLGIATASRRPEKAIYRLKELGETFCKVMGREMEVKRKNDNSQIYWKRFVKSTRELCDVCATSVFNLHWTCGKCGFVVCLDCHDAYRQPTIVAGVEQANKDENGRLWLKCTKTIHLLPMFMLTQLIPGNCLEDLISDLHSQIDKWNIEHICKWRADNPLVLLANTACLQDEVSSSSPSPVSSEEHFTMEGLISRMVAGSYNSDNHSNTSQLSSHESKKFEQLGSNMPLPSPTASKRSWLCENRVLWLQDPTCVHNVTHFQEELRKGTPVLVSGCDTALDKRLWSPAGFGAEFGSRDIEVVDCLTQTPFANIPMDQFWRGFQDVSLRVQDRNRHESTVILKLKDWPGSQDFRDIMPERYNNISQAFPLPEYAQRDGVFNLSSSLPDDMVKPDLGPKMYCAYGSPGQPSIGSTNLHVDISDAFNIMVHTSCPIGHSHEAVVNDLREMNLDSQTWARLEAGEIPGAVWHIFHSDDSSGLKAFLRKVGKEQGKQQLPQHDPIHDQNIYITPDLIKRLAKENIKPWTIVQFQGDCIFIPAGCPHQVRNVNSCIKLAQDFVSPERMRYCLRTTDEFRHLSDKHSNHEDKLQVKNILYHAVKDALTLMMSSS